mgnify:CR=1 FL=1
MITIREENKNDLHTIKNINDKAFNQQEEGIIIDKIRKSNSQILSLVAEKDNKTVGHIFYSQAEIDCNNETIIGMGLAPMAVLPKFQKQGIGKKLITDSLEILKALEIPFIIVLGHEDYYPKFGFEKASNYNIKCQWKGVPDAAFMIMILDKEKMLNISGVAKYREEWNEAM